MWPHLTENCQEEQRAHGQPVYVGGRWKAAIRLVRENANCRWDHAGDQAGDCDDLDEIPVHQDLALSLQCQTHDRHSQNQHCEKLITKKRRIPVSYNRSRAKRHRIPTWRTAQSQSCPSNLTITLNWHILITHPYSLPRVSTTSAPIFVEPLSYLRRVQALPSKPSSQHFFVSLTLLLLLNGRLRVGLPSADV